MMTFLHVGCGLKNKFRTTPVFASDTWHEIRLDINPAVRPDVTGSITDMRAIADGSLDAVFSSHNIEHLYAHEVSLALQEFWRVLRPQGHVVVTCPDLQSLGELLARDALLEPVLMVKPAPITPLDILYGYRPALAAGDVFMAHHSGFTQTTLIQALQEAGFASTAALRTHSPPYDLWAVACKTPCDGADMAQWLMAHSREQAIS